MTSPNLIHTPTSPYTVSPPPPCFSPSIVYFNEESMESLLLEGLVRNVAYTPSPVVSPTSPTASLGLMVPTDMNCSFHQAFAAPFCACPMQQVPPEIYQQQQNHSASGKQLVCKGNIVRKNKQPQIYDNYLMKFTMK